MNKSQKVMYSRKKGENHVNQLIRTGNDRIV